jgi:DNA-directed RNA polymerase specialized sigma24 family protein
VSGWLWRILLGLVIDRLETLRREHSRLEALRRLGIR